MLDTVLEEVLVLLTFATLLQSEEGSSTPNSVVASALSTFEAQDVEGGAGRLEAVAAVEIHV